MNLFQLGDFTLNSGAKSTWKIECDALTNKDWDGLAQMVRQLVGTFSSVEGVPRGGLKLAEALKPYCAPNGPHLVVDDVWTPGRSLLSLMGSCETGRTKQVFGAVVFARGQLSWSVKAMFQMPECFWVAKRTR